jgi:hypothetical protein
MANTFPSNNLDSKLIKSSEHNILKTIRDLQESEKKLYEILSTQSAETPNINLQPIINKINTLSKTRINLYKNLGDSYKNVKSNAQNTRSDLVDQKTFTQMMEQELNSTKQYINKIQNVKNSKLRMVEINTYYGKRYKAHAELMQMIIIICIPFLVLGIIKKKGVIQNNSIVNYITAILIIIAVIIIGIKLYDISRRNNMSFDEYNWFFDPATNDPTVYQYDMQSLLGTEGSISQKISDLAQNIGAGCVGKECCDANGLEYDKATEKCTVVKKKPHHGHHSPGHHSPGYHSPGPHSPAPAPSPSSRHKNKENFYSRVPQPQAEYNNYSVL